MVRVAPFFLTHGVLPGPARGPILISHLYSVDCVAVTGESKAALLHCVGDVRSS